MLDLIKYALKSLTKNKTYTLINVGGLTLGLSVALALAMSIVGLAGLTTLIVGWHIIWAARRNPVEALRYE